MIWTPIVLLVAAFLEGIIALLPAYNGYPAGVTSAVSYFAGKVWGLNCVLPIADILQVLRLDITIAFGLLLFRFLAWVFHWHQGVGVTKE